MNLLVLAAKSMSLLSPFLFSQNLNYPPKIQILTNVRTSSPQKIIKIYDYVFIWIKKFTLNGVFGFGSNGFDVIVITLLAIKLRF